MGNGQSVMGNWQLARGNVSIAGLADQPIADCPLPI
jgi:hypothetical protein